MDVTGILCLLSTIVHCSNCLQGKQTCKKFRKLSFNHSTRILQLLHVGRYIIFSKFFALFIDDYTRKMWISFLKVKFDALNAFQILKNQIKNKTSLKIVP